MQHGLEDLKQSLAEQAAGLEATMAPPKTAASDANADLRRAEPPKRNRGALPAHLPRAEVMIDIEEGVSRLRQHPAHDQRRSG